MHIRLMVINENSLRNIIRNILYETMDRSYRYDLHNEIPARISDWEYDSWDDETDERNRQRLSKRLGGRDMSHFTYPNGGSNTSLSSELKKLGFRKVHYQSGFGSSVNWGLEYYLIERVQFEKVRKQYESLLNFFNFMCVKMRHNDGQDWGYDYDDGIEVTLEPVFTSRANNIPKDRIFYHATPNKSVAKILRQGLVPKDRGQLNLKRPERIYLTTQVDMHIVKELEEKNDQEYTILKVDLSSMPDIKLYNDPYYDNAGCYCVSYIPPRCISVLDVQPHKLERERKKEIKEWIEELCNSLGLDYYPEYNAIHGSINGMDIDLQINIFPEFAFYSCSIEGNIKKMNKNGKAMISKWHTNGMLNFGGRNMFKYEEIKPLLIGKYIKKILETGSKAGISGFFLR